MGVEMFFFCVHCWVVGKKLSLTELCTYVCFSFMRLGWLVAAGWLQIWWHHVVVLPIAQGKLVCHCKMMKLLTLASKSSTIPTVITSKTPLAVWERESRWAEALSGNDLWYKTLSHGFCVCVCVCWGSCSFLLLNWVPDKTFFRFTTLGGHPGVFVSGIWLQPGYWHEHIHQSFKCLVPISLPPSSSLWSPTPSVFWHLL